MFLLRLRNCERHAWGAALRNISGRLTVVGWLLVLLPGPALALETGFLPGDACFGSWLSGETVAKFESGGPVRFEYLQGAGVPAFCGHAGYWNLEVHEMPVAMREGLTSVYRSLREFQLASYEITQDESGAENRRETNPFQILIYNKSYDVRRGLGLKFNENWMSLVHYDRQGRYPGAYSPYVTDHRAIVRDWRGGPGNAGLTIKEEDAKPFWGPRLETPVSVNGADIQIVLLPAGLKVSHALAQRDEQTLGDEAYFYRITDEGVTECHWEEGNAFVEEAWPADEATLAARDRQATLKESLDSLDRALSDTYGIDEESLPDDVRKRLEQLREVGEDLIEDLDKLSKRHRETTASEATPDSW